MTDGAGAPPPPGSLPAGALAGIAVVEALAAARNVAPADVRDPLYDSVDPDALDRLFAYGDAADAADGTVAFSVGGRTVTVHSDGTIVVGARD
jgi:hypothetical protein